MDAYFQKDYPQIKIVVLGYPGDDLDGMLLRFHQINYLKPQKVFLMAGINDLSKGITIKDFQKKINMLLDSISLENPSSQLYVESILPVNHEIRPQTPSADKIRQANNAIKDITDQRHLFYMDLYSLYVDSHGEMSRKYTKDGLHLNSEGYMIWKNALSDILKNENNGTKR